MVDKILVLNSGSTSLKYKLFSLDKLELISEGNYQQVGDRSDTVKDILRQVGNVGDLAFIGHRVVHGGNRFVEPTLVTPESLIEIKKYNHLAPLHNPANIEGIELCQEYLPRMDNYAVFDTAFYCDLPEEVRHYPIPLEITRQHDFYRFGFHGISHKYIANKVAQDLKKDIKKLKIISCHLGGGASVTAIKNGAPVETSMGYTPLEGLMMISRCGDIDPGVILEMVKKYDVEVVDEILNYKSGIYGISGISNYLEFLKQKNLGNAEANLAFKMFVHRIRKYVGAYYATMGGCDAVVFTGMIGAGRPETREAVVENMDWMKKTKIMSLMTDEEYQIATEVKLSIENDL